MQIRVNALSPGYTPTPLVEQFFTKHDPSLPDQVISVHPIRRTATPA